MEPDQGEEDAVDFELRTTVFLSKPNTCGVEMEISDEIGGFNAMFLIYLRDIAELDISGCVSIPALDFIDCVVACSNLKLLNMRGCKQFADLHLMQMIPKLSNLGSLCLEECQEIGFPVAFWILSSLPNLFMIDFEPRNPEVEIKDWRRLFHTFFRVHFRVSFRHMFPNYGDYVRWDGDKEEEY